MNISEAAALLALASEFDNREVTETKAAAWHSILRDLPFQECSDFILEFQRIKKPGEYLEVTHVYQEMSRRLRFTPDDIAADVRSARARGIVDADWPLERPLSLEAAERLRETRVSHDTNLGEISPPRPAQGQSEALVRLPEAPKRGFIPTKEGRRKAMEELDRMRKK